MTFYILPTATNEVANLYFRVMISGKRFQCNTKIKVNTNDWKTGKFFTSAKREDKEKRILLNKIECALVGDAIIGSKEELNALINSIVNAEAIEAQDRHEQFLQEQAEKKRIEEERKEALRIKAEEERKRLEEESVILAYERFIEDIATQRRNYRKKVVSEATMKQHTNTLRYLKKFVGDSGILFCNLNKVFYDSFVHWLYQQDLSYNTIGNRIKCIKAVVNAQPLKLRIQADEFMSKDKCPVLKEETLSIALTEDEVNAIAKVDLSKHRRLEPYRNQFVLMCWTGVRYSDLDKLTYDNINAEHGVFVLEAQKTKSTSMIKIFPQAQEILDLYDGGKSMPKVISDQKFNEALKEIMQIVAERCGGSFLNSAEKRQTKMDAKGKIKRTPEVFCRWQMVSAHTARRTFATNMRKRGNDFDVIRSATGHSSEEALRRYIKNTQIELALQLK